MTVSRFKHASLTVADMDASLAFWRDLLGLGLLGDPGLGQTLPAGEGTGFERTQ